MKKKKINFFLGLLILLGLFIFLFVFTVFYLTIRNDVEYTYGLCSTGSEIVKHTVLAIDFDLGSAETDFVDCDYCIAISLESLENGNTSIEWGSVFLESDLKSNIFTGLITFRHKCRGRCDTKYITFGYLWLPLVVIISIIIIKRRNKIRRIEENKEKDIN